MERRLEAVLLIVLVASVLVVAIFTIPILLVRPAPLANVSGGYLRIHNTTTFEVRTIGPNTTISLSWDEASGFGHLFLVISNINPSKTQIESDCSPVLIKTYPSAIKLEISTTNVNAWVKVIQRVDPDVNFYVFGDSQGYQGGIEQVVRAAALHSPDFVFHCGDLTPFGEKNQYLDTLSALRPLTVPLYTTPGNHDVRSNGSQNYLYYFGPDTYSFDWGPVHITSFNTSKYTVTDLELDWLETDLAESNAEWKFVFTHVPIADPRTEENHTFSVELAEELASIFSNTNVDVVFSGHIHMFANFSLDNVQYIITGGAGMGLYASEEEGGFYHYVNVSVSGNELKIKTAPLETPSIDRNQVVIRGVDTTITLNIADLSELNTIEEYSSFQNQFGNWRGQGIYRGVRILDLLDLVGGLNPDDTIRVTAIDGFFQDFCYSNVYPNISWYQYQGDMILAYMYNETIVPEWEDGMRIIMIPEDGAYSNNDCVMTSASGMGCSVYISGGTRWIRYVAEIEVISD